MPASHFLKLQYVMITVELSRSMGVPNPPRVEVRRRPAQDVPATLPEGTWEQLDQVDLEEILLMRVPMLKSCPYFLRGRLRECFAVTLRERYRAKTVGDRVAEDRAWKAFALVPMMLLNKPKGGGSVGRDELGFRVDKFSRGEWGTLLKEATDKKSGPRRGETSQDVAAEQQRRGKAAQSRVEQGQVSRARQELTGATLAPKTGDTLRELQERRPRERVREIPAEILNYVADQPLVLDGTLFSKCLASAPAGSAPGPGGCTNEMLKVCLDDVEVTQFLFLAAQDMARADIPDSARCLMVSTMTALRKRDGGVRGIATGTSFRRLIAKTLARQFGKVVESTCAPFQFALSTRAGTDCVGHPVRVMTDADPDATILSIDGVGAYDHVLRSAMMNKLHDVPGLRALLPFVRSTYANTTRYTWEDAAGVRHQIHQAEGGEQGDPLMPLLFSLAIHDALVAVQAELREGEVLFAYLDDVYAVTGPNRTRDVYNLLAEHLWRVAGIQLHTGKTRSWNKSGISPPNVEDLGEQVWSREGIKVLGTPVGTHQFVSDVVTERVQEESRLWEAIGWVPDLQAAWQILLQCAGPRCHHLLRTLPPSQSRQYAVMHDEGMMRVMDSLMGGLPGESQAKEDAYRLATLPMRMGGLGLRSATRMAPAAYWASWADALHMVQERLPALAQSTVIQLEQAEEPAACLGELRAAATCLDRHGFVGRPGWVDLQMGVRPPPVDESEPGEWAHGWQHYASSASEYHYRKSRCLAPVVSCQPGASPVSFRTGFVAGSARMPHQARVQDRTRPFPHSHFGEIALAVTRVRSKVRVRIDPG